MWHAPQLQLYVIELVQNFQLSSNRDLGVIKPQMFEESGRDELGSKAFIGMQT